MPKQLELIEGMRARVNDPSTGLREGEPASRKQGNQYLEAADGPERSTPASVR